MRIIPDMTFRSIHIFFSHQIFSYLCSSQFLEFSFLYSANSYCSLLPSHALSKVYLLCTRSTVVFDLLTQLFVLGWNCCFFFVDRYANISLIFGSLSIYWLIGLVSEVRRPEWPLCRAAEEGKRLPNHSSTSSRRHCSSSFRLVLSKEYFIYRTYIIFQRILPLITIPLNFSFNRSISSACNNFGFVPFI